MGADDFFTFDVDFEPELDFTFFADELFADLPVETLPLFAPDRTRVIFPRVELVFLDFFSVDVFGMFLSSGTSVFFGLEIFTLRDPLGSEAFVDVLPGEFSMLEVLPPSVFSRILPLTAGVTAGCVLDRLIRPIFVTEFLLRATFETSLALS